MTDDLPDSADFGVIHRHLARDPVVVRGHRLFVAEQDILLDDDALVEYAQQAAAAERKPEDAPPDHSFVDRGHRLLARTRGGLMVRWRDGLSLTYAVDEASFARTRDYETVAANMLEATKAWQDACGIRFAHRAEADDLVAGERPDDIVFIVTRVDAMSGLIAAAFFPDDPRDRRTVVICPSYFAATLSFDRVGVLRHELGHVLGFRHEHIRQAGWRGCGPESLADTSPLTAYDSKSVMHYLCDGVGSPALELTDVDREGAVRLYGPPLEQFHLVS